MTDQIGFAEELVAAVIIALPAGAWWNGMIAFKTVTVAYLVLITLFVGLGLNQLILAQRAEADDGA